MSNQSSFLPEDYLAQKAERRTNLISLVLFVVVMLGVFLAFLFTNQKWTQVKADQGAINTQYQQAANDISVLQELKEQRSQMLEKADLAAALVERVPRSILLADLINRMPDRLSLLEFELRSEKMTPIVRRNETERTGSLKPARALTREEAGAVRTKVQAPRYKVSISLVGVAPTDLELARYLAELNAYPLLRDVSLEYSEEKEIETRLMRQFEVKMRLDPDADVRDVAPLVMPRNPMTDELRLQVPVGPSDSVRAIDADARQGGS